MHVGGTELVLDPFIERRVFFLLSFFNKKKLDGIISEVLNDPIAAAIQSRLGTNSAKRLYAAVQKFNQIVKVTPESEFAPTKLRYTIEDIVERSIKESEN